MIRCTKSIKYSNNFLGCYVKPGLIKDLSYKKLENLELKDDVIMKNKFLGYSTKCLIKKKKKTEHVFLMKSKKAYKERGP